jgi:integrase
MQVRMLVRGGRVITASDNYRADVLIEDEIVTRIGSSIAASEADQVVEADGAYVLPGGVDPHTHLDAPVGGTRTSDTFASGTVAAAYGGTPTVLSFFPAEDDETLTVAFDRVRATARDQVAIDYGLHVVIRSFEDQISKELEGLVERGVTSLKLFMAYPGELMVDDGTLFRVLRRGVELGMTSCIHAENGLKIDGGYSPPTKEETLTQLFDRWYCDILSTQVQQDARDNYKCIADCHIVPTLGRKKVAKLTVADVQHLLASKLSGGPDGDPRPLSVSTVRRIRSVLAQALEVCLVDGSLTRNVAALTSAPKAAGTEGRTLTHAQAKRLLKELEGHRLGALFIVMLSTGLRRGEALGLRWDDVDLRKRVVVVRRQLRRIGGQLITREVKGRKSGRSVDLPAPVVQLLKDHRTAQAAARTGSNGLWEESGFVFTTQYGSALDPRNVHRDFQTICMKAKLGKWHPHELRHSAASLMLAEGVPLQVVSDILGHSSIRITADVYGHVLQPQRREAARAMAGALWG